MMKYEVAHLSSTGGRSGNEDRVGIAERPNAVLLVVADGLGGHTGGELAAQTVVETVLRLFHGVKQPKIDDPFAFLALTMLKAHHTVVERAKAHVPPLEARTTCVLCLVQEGYAYWGHVGDSRLYHFRNHRLVRRTEDHSTIEELRRDGVISEEEMARHPRKSYLLRSLGGRGEPRITLSEETPLKTGDVLLLCSDGVWEAITTEEMAKYAAMPNVEHGMDEMLSSAEKRMGENCDNVTVACLRYQDRTVVPLPGRGPVAKQVDAKLLWQGAAANKAAAQRTIETEPKAEDRRDKIEDRINEIEEYLRKFEPKS